MKVAIVHDFLTQMGGAEKVVEVFHDMFPDAPIYTSVFDAKAMPAYYRTWDIRTSFMQRLAKHKFLHRAALLLYPTAFESFDLSEYDLVLSSSSAFAKGVVTSPDAVHVCYTHAPMRYVWNTRSYVSNESMSKPLRSLLTPGLHYLRTWDSIASTRVDRYIGNSSAVAKRINKFYRREAEVIHPPVDIDRFAISETVEDYCILVSRFVPYKRIDLAVQAFTKMNKRLKVVGTGRQMKDLQAMAGPTIEFMGRVDDVELPGMMARARAYIMPGEEDFGIAPVEANACGRPVIAFAAGGALDVQVDGETGVLFHEQTVDALCAAVERMESIEWNPQRIRENAERFTTEIFRQKILTAIASTEVGDRRQVQKERRKNRTSRPVENDRRRVLVESGRPVWYDRRHHGAHRENETLSAGELPNGDDDERVAVSEQVDERRAPLRPENYGELRISTHHEIGAPNNGVHDGHSSRNESTAYLNGKGIYVERRSRKVG